MPPNQSTGLYSNAQEAAKTLKEDYSYWTGKLTESSFAVSLAVIGANWAVFGSVDKIFENSCATWSVAVVGASLVVSLIASYWLGELTRKQISHAEEDPERWQKEFSENIGTSTPWPLTPKIDWVAWSFRMARMLLPIAGVLLFLVALFTQSRTPPKNESDVPTSIPQATVQPLTAAPTPPTTPSATVSPAGSPTATPAATRGPPLHPTPVPHPSVRGKRNSSR